jgi:hypothetical protein
MRQRFPFGSCLMTVGCSAKSRRGRSTEQGVPRIEIRVSFGNRPCGNLGPSLWVGRPGQRLGPNPGGGVERGIGGVAVVRLVARTALGVALLGVCDS